MSRAHILRSGPLTPPLTGTQLNAYLEYMPPAEVEKSRNFITYEKRGENNMVVYAPVTVSKWFTSKKHFDGKVQYPESHGTAC